MAMCAIFIDKSTGEVVETVQQGTMTFNQFRNCTNEISSKYPVDQYKMIHDNKTNINEEEKTMARTYSFQLTNVEGEIVGVINAPSHTAARDQAIVKHAANTVRRITTEQANIILEGIEMTYNKAIEEVNAEQDLSKQYTKLNNLLHRYETRGDDVKVNLITQRMAELDAKINPPKEKKTPKAKKTITVDMSKAKAPKAEKSAPVKEKKVAKADKPAKQSKNNTITDEQTKALDLVENSLIEEDGKTLKLESKMVDGVLVITTEAHSKKLGDRYRTLYVSKRGSVTAWGKRPTGKEPRLFTRYSSVISFGYNSKPEELKK